MATTKLPYHHGDLKRALVAAAVQILEEQGLSALTLSDVALRAHVTKAAPYHHFANKQALLAAVAEDGFRALYAQLTRAAATEGPDPSKRLRAMGVAYVRFAQEHRGHFDSMFGIDLSPWDRFPGLRDAASLSFFLMRSTATEAGLDETEFASAWALVHGLAMLWVGGPLRSRAPKGIEALTRAAIDRFLRGPRQRRK